MDGMTNESRSLQRESTGGEADKLKQQLQDSLAMTNGKTAKQNKHQARDLMRGRIQSLNIVKPGS